MAGTLVSGEKSGRGTLSAEELWWKGRAEIDTSAPFESVKEAVDHFGGSGHWKPQHMGQNSFDSECDHCTDDIITNVEEETGHLEKDLTMKERETLEVLKELEMTKRILSGLKLKVQKESSKSTLPLEKNPDSTKVHPIIETQEHSPRRLINVGSNIGAKSSPSSILTVLKQAKLNLNRTTSDLAGLRSSIEAFKSELKKEKMLMEKACERIVSNSARICSMEKELSHTRLILQLVKDSGFKSGSGYPPHISRKIHELRSETEQFKRMAAGSESEMLKLTEEIEQTKAGIKTLEVRVLAARKVEEVARATQVVSLAETKALTNAKDVEVPRYLSGVTLSLEEYNILIHKAQAAEELSRKRIEVAMTQVYEANKYNTELSKRAEEANAEVKNSRKALDEALLRVEVANKGKVDAEDALRKWRSDHGQKRRSVHDSPRFKNPCASHYRRDSKMMEVDGSSLIIDGTRSVLRPTLSIGQILSKKLMEPDEWETKMETLSERPKISLGQMLNRRHWVSSPERNGDAAAPRKSFHARKKKLGFVGSFSLILVNPNVANKKKKKRQAWSPK